MLQPLFNVTQIADVATFYTKNTESETTIYPDPLKFNELVFHLRGKSEVIFNGKRMKARENDVRFLPAGEVSQYEVYREDPGAYIDIFFSTDIPISEEAFIVSVFFNLCQL